MKGRTFEKEVYTASEIDSLLRATSSSAPSAIRNRAIICTLWQSGLRINELMDLRPADFDLGSLELHVRHGKGDRARRVRIGPDAVSAIEAWLVKRSSIGMGPDAPLFCTLSGRKLHGSYVRETLRRLAKRAGWTKRIHPHGFRHTFAVNLARNGMPVPYIQRQLGHGSLATTSIYLAAISTDDIAEAMDRVQWR